MRLMCLRSCSAHAMASARDGRDAANRGSNRLPQKNSIFEELRLDAVCRAMVAQFAEPARMIQLAVELLPWLRPPRCGRLGGV